MEKFTAVIVLQTDTKKNSKNSSDLEMLVSKKTGWEDFPEDFSWFIYDFFKYELSGFEKLIFLSYYVNHLKLQEIGEAALCSHQYIDKCIKQIESRMKVKWEHRKNWVKIRKL
jgi:hypothetical protein